MRPSATQLWTLDSPTIAVQASSIRPGATGTLRVPCPSYLVRHDRGLVLFDTGIAPEVAEDSTAFDARYPTLQIDYPHRTRLADQLGLLGLALGDIGYVVTSHAHHDHCGGLRLFPDARHVIGAEEIRWAHWPDPPGEQHFDPSCFQPLRGADWTHVPKHHDLDIFDDGAVVVLSTPGHTRGSLSLQVRLPDATYILAGDALHLRSALDAPHAGAFDYDSREAIDSILRLRSLARAAAARVLVSHDPDDWAELPRCPTPLPGSDPAWPVTS